MRIEYKREKSDDSILGASDLVFYDASRSIAYDYNYSQYICAKQRHHNVHIV